MKTNYLLASLLSLFLLGCTSDSIETIEGSGDDNTDLPATPVRYFPPLESADWETVDPASLDWNASAEGALRDFLESNGTKAFMILKDGRIAVEWYFDEHTVNTSWYWASAGKTLTAFAVGIAEAEGLLDVNDTSADYLGQGWTGLTMEKENLIKIKHQLTMTSGLNDLEFDCITPDCLEYLADAGTRWAYHNGPYTLLQDVVANASAMDWTDYFNQKLRDRIGMDGFWFSTSGTNNVYFSTARSMARFGLLNLNGGQWEATDILSNEAYESAMRVTSQELNAAYGYLWWLNGKDSYRAPGLQAVFDGELIPNAPADTYAGLGKNDQKLYIVPSRGLVILRQGDDSGDDLLGPSSFDNALWERLSAYLD
ncbi:serine hydrolase [Flagellimonas sp. DF-77]|uniref:serine hydrolase domain-containing protein n=1 Tax=Flagellimonas algarum TaxID=3230298 RepID=UPI003395FA4C